MAVDLNPVTIRIIKDVYKDYTLNRYNSPGIEVYAAEGRSFVSRSNRKFTNIHMNGVDTLNALASGAFVTAENYLYTVEAMEDYVEHIEDDGVLSIVRAAFDVPRETFKLCTAMIAACKTLGIEDVSKYIKVFGEKGSVWATFMFKKSPWTPDELANYEKIAQRQHFLIYYSPGMEITEDMDYSLSRNKYFVQLFDAYREGRIESFYEEYPYDIRPITDDRPFFFKVHKARDFLNPTKESTPYESNFGLVALLVLLFQTIIMSALLIILPLVRFHREGLQVPSRSLYLVYFAGLGLSFMLVELSLMQKLSLLLGHPTYSIAVVLSSMLLFSGIGSLTSGLWKGSPKGLIALAILGVALILAVYIPLIPVVTDMTLSLPWTARALVAMVLLAPLSFLMGMPFPTGLRMVTTGHRRFVPWAWGVNGVASVLGTVTAIFLAMSYGFNVVIMLAIIIYVTAAISILFARKPTEQEA